MSASGDRQDVLRLSPAPSDLARLYPWLEAAARAAPLPPELMNSMHVALEEAVMNVAMHAFPPGASGEIAVSLGVCLDAAKLVVEDTGRPFDPTRAEPRARPATMEEAQPGGLGLTLLRHYCRDLRYERAAGRNRLTLSFPLAPAPR